jgi:hypothetical protein
MMRAICLFLLALGTAVPVHAAQREWRFTVYLDNKEIGYHHFRVNEREGEMQVESEARFDVRFVFITAYRYTHHDVENWRGDCLREMQSRTDDNGDMQSVRGRSDGAQFVVETATRHDALPGCVMSFAYWNQALLGQQRLLNAQTGEYTLIRVVPPVDDSVRVRGQTVPAQRYAIDAGPLHIELWYSPAGEWLALQSTTPSGRLLRYALN